MDTSWLDYLKQDVAPEAHPEIVERLRKVREDLPKVSRTASPGFVSMYDNLKAVERMLLEDPQSVLDDLIHAAKQAAGSRELGGDEDGS